MESTGQCAEGYRLSESDCELAVEFGSGYGGSGDWAAETCGCYIDQDGQRYYKNVRDDDRCDNFDDLEEMICFAHQSNILFLHESLCFLNESV